MSTFQSLITMLNEVPSCGEKSQIVAALLNSVKSAKLTDEDAGALSAFVFAEIGRLFTLIDNAGCYKDKCELFDYEDKLLGLVMAIYPSADKIPAEKLETVKQMVELVNKERYLESAVDHLFEADAIEENDVQILLHIASTVKDEYQRGQLFFGLLNYKEQFKKLSGVSKQAIGGFIASEMERCLQEKNAIDEDKANNLEVMCDVCQYFMNDAIVTSLYEILKLGRNHVNVYAIATLMSAKQSIPQATVDALARDLEYADMTYGFLERYGQTALFPSELSEPEYLAKSDLVHWLTFPTELGKAPDAIEYLGKTKVKREVFYVFRFRSDSDNLGDDLKNKWLIGWSSNEGGTFSNFDEYGAYEQKTPEKTVKYIKKKLL